MILSRIDIVLDSKSQKTTNLTKTMSYLFVIKRMNSEPINNQSTNLLPGLET